MRKTALPYGGSAFAGVEWCHTTPPSLKKVVTERYSGHSSHAIPRPVNSLLGRRPAPSSSTHEKSTRDCLVYLPGGGIDRSLLS